MSESEKHIRHHRCFNHGNREAAAKCPECGRNFCRECVTEHKLKMLCRECMDSLDRDKEKKYSHKWGTLFSLGLIFVFSTYISWLFFYWIGSCLASIPEKYHEGAFLNERFFD